MTTAFIALVFGLTILSCQNATTIKSQNETVHQKLKTNSPTNKLFNSDSVIISKKHRPNTITGDIDGDGLTDTVNMVQHVRNKKYGLRIAFANKNTTYLGMGKEVLGQGFDDMDWVGIFEKAPKGEIYWNNVNDEGEIITEEEVKEQDKIKLPNDGIFIHQSESCGGGVIYFKKGKFEWIQQE